MINYIYGTHGAKVLLWNDIVNPRKVEEYYNAISAKSSPLDTCFGFIDGTFKTIRRPDRNQRVLYKGHKRIHAIKFKCLALPNEMFVHLYEPFG